MKDFKREDIEIFKDFIKSRIEIKDRHSEKSYLDEILKFTSIGTNTISTALTVASGDPLGLGLLATDFLSKSLSDLLIYFHDYKQQYPEEYRKLIKILKESDDPNKKMLAKQLLRIYDYKEDPNIISELKKNREQDSDEVFYEMLDEFYKLTTTDSLEGVNKNNVDKPDSVN